MLYGGGAAGPRGPPMAQIEVTNGGVLAHLAASPANQREPRATLIVGGQQCLATLELHVPERSVGAAASEFDFPRNRVKQLRDPRTQTARLPPSKCTGVCFHPEMADLAASCSADGTVSLWDVCAVKREAKWQAHSKQVNAVAFLPSSSGPAHARLVSAAGDGSLHLTRLVDLLSAWERRKEERGSSASVTSNPGGEADRSGAAASQRPELLSDGKAKMEALMSGDDPPMTDLWKEHRHRRARTHDLDVERSASKILVAQDDGSVKLFDVRSERISFSRDFLVATGAVMSARFHDTIPSVFATAGQAQDGKNNVRVIDEREQSAGGGVRVASRIGPCEWFGCVRWRPDHPGQLATTRSVNTMSSRGTMGWGILVWDLRKPHTPLHQLNHHADLTPDFLWADPNHIIACGRDSTVQLHSVASSHQPIAAVPRGAAAWCVGSGGSESLALLWEDVDDPEEDVGSVEGPAEEGAVEDPVGDFAYQVTRRGGLGRTQEAPTQAKVARADRLIQGLKEDAGDRLVHLFRADAARAPDPERPLRPAEDPGLLELTLLGRFQRPEPGTQASQLCAAAAARLASAGLEPRAQVWRLLAKVVLDDEAPESLLAAALSEAPSALRDDPSLRTSPAAGSALASQQGKGWRRTWCVEALRNVIEDHEGRNQVGMLLSLVFTLGLDMDQLDDLARQKVVQWAKRGADLLGRMRAFVPRAALLREMPMPEVKELAQKGTALYLRCAHCPSQTQAIQPAGGLNAPKQPPRRQSTGGGAAAAPAEARGAGTADPGAAAPAEASGAGAADSGAAAAAGAAAEAAQGAEAPEGRREGKGRRKGGAPAAGAAAGRGAARASCGGCGNRRTPACALCGQDVRGLWVGCQTCGHGGHPAHMRAWFADGHRECPVPWCSHRCVPA